MGEGKQIVRRVALVTVPILVLFLVSAFVVLLVRAPKTASAHWATPKSVLSGNGSTDFGAVARPDGSWDILRFDAGSNKLIYTARAGSRTPSRPVTLAQGDLAQPSLAQAGQDELGVWVHNGSNYSDLDAVVVAPGRAPRVLRVLRSPAAIDHPYAFAGPNGRMDIVFAWQRSGNFAIYFTSLAPGDLHPTTPRQIPQAGNVYSLYPIAAGDGSSQIVLLNFRSCCAVDVWKAVLTRLDAGGRVVGKSQVLVSISRRDLGTWGEAMVRDGAGNVWGAFATAGGADMFKVNSAGALVSGPVVVDPSDAETQSLAIELEPGGGTLFWDEPGPLGRFIDSRRFDTDLRPGAIERVEYTPGVNSGVHAAVIGGKLRVLWQGTTFETSSRHPHASLSLADRLGLGLGNPLVGLIVLTVSALALAVLASVANIITIAVVAAIGMIVLRLMRPLPGRWYVYIVLVTVALFVIFVKPGGLTLFLSTMPSLGLSTVPFGILATLAVLALLIWLSRTVLHRIDDVFRAGLLVLAGVYFFAFLETVVFVQQQLGNV